jgi:hypothetical protein
VRRHRAGAIDKQGERAIAPLPGRTAPRAADSGFTRQSDSRATTPGGHDREGEQESEAAHDPTVRTDVQQNCDGLRQKGRTGAPRRLESMDHVDTTGTSDPCACGVCGTDVPPLVGSMLTGTGLTLDAAARRLESGASLPAMTEVQRRMVEAHAEARLAH